MKNAVEELLKKENVRTNLSNLRAMIKEPAAKNKLSKMLKEHHEFVISLLDEEDAKTRRNAALLIGDLAWDEAVDKLFEAYEKETMLFVRSSYLDALFSLEAEKLVDKLHGRMNTILNTELTAETRKHAEEELRALRKLLIKYQGITRHNFSEDGKNHDVVLITNRNHREIIRRQVEENGEKAKLHPLGVLVNTSSIKALFKIRTFREMVFPIHTDGLISDNPEDAAQALWKADIYDILTSLHKEEGPFYYRIDCKGNMELEERSRFTKKLSAALDHLSGGRMVNSAGDYEVELRLVANKEGKFFACLKLSTVEDHRFDYRKNSISASIHPSTAALMMTIAQPFLKEEAQIMDPFCGVGTMMIERDKCVPAREMYGTDIYGEAIVKARENAMLAGKNINFIHRDFFDFKHDYKFDEIVTNMPIRGKKTKEELDRLYSNFFDKVADIFMGKGTIVMYTNEMGLVKKQLRLKKGFRILQETCMQTKSSFFLLIIDFEG